MPISPIRIFPELFNPSGVAFGWSSLLTYCREGLSLVSLSDEREPFLLLACGKTKAPLVRLPTRACHAGRHSYFWGVIDSTSQYLIANVHLMQKPVTPPKETSKRNFLRGLRDTIDHLGL